MAKTRAYGADCILLATFETVYGTLPADGYGRLSFKDSSLGAERPLGYDPLLGQGRDAQDPFYEAIKDEGDIGVPLDVRALGFWLKGLFGAPATTDNGDGTFDHVFTSGGTLPSLAIEIGHAQLAVPKFFRHGGAKLDKLSFDMARSGAANASIGVIAQGETEAAAAIAAESPVVMEYGFTIPGSAFALTFHLPRVFCPKKKQEIKGPGGIQARAEWHFGGGPEYCRACPGQRSGGCGGNCDCPYERNAPLTEAGWQAWELLTGAIGAIRIGPRGGITGLDLPALLIQAQALGYDQALLVRLLPFAERGMVAGSAKVQTET